MGLLSTAEISQMIYAGACILIIDDDEDIRDILRLSLEREGYRVTLAATGIEGLRKLMDEEPCDLLLLDLVLPDIDGWAILSRVRATPIMARIPIIMMTANSDIYSETELLAAGADDYLMKPFSFDNLLAHIQALLRRAALQTINPLTGLPGNRQVERFLQQCVKETTRFWAAAYIDIDNFKRLQQRFAASG
jgi:DNA-binding response OmpR family regulator